MSVFANADRPELAAMSRSHRRFCATLVYALAAGLLWLALGAAEAPRDLARAEQIERAAPANDVAPTGAVRPRSG